MRTQDKVKTNSSGKQTSQAMAITAPNQRGATLDNRGFTLVELIVVCAIIGILMIIAVPAFHDLTLRAKNGAAKADISTLNKAITSYYLDQNRYPNLLTDLGMQANIRDPWKHTYQYRNLVAGTGDPGPQYTDYHVNPLNDDNDFDLYSLGPDGLTAHQIPDPTDPAISNSRDDIVRIANGHDFVLASEF